MPAPTTVGVWSEPTVVLLERGRIRSFAEAIGETDARYFDLDHARRLGHPDLPLPLTFPFTLESDAAETLAFMTALGVDPLAVLHGEQLVEWSAALHAGQAVAVRHRFAEDDVRAGKGLRVLVRETQIVADGTPSVLLRATWIVRTR